MAVPHVIVVGASVGGVEALMALVGGDVEDALYPEMVNDARAAAGEPDIAGPADELGDLLHERALASAFGPCGPEDRGNGEVDAHPEVRSGSSRNAPRCRVGCSTKRPDEATTWPRRGSASRSPAGAAARTVPG